MMVGVMRFNVGVKLGVDGYLDCSAACFPSEMKKFEEDNKGISKKAKALYFISLIEELIIELGLPNKLRDVQIKEGDVDKLVEGAMLQTRLLPNNVRAIDAEDAKEIYLCAL